MTRPNLRSLCALAVLLAPPLVWADVVVEPPTLTMNPNGKTPLAGIIELTTHSPTQVTLEISDGFDLWRVKYPEVAELHSHPLLGLKPNRVYTVEVILSPGGSAGTLLAVTDPLPEHFPAVTTLVSDPQRMEPGYTLLDCVRHGRGDPRPTYSMIVNDRGDVVWYSTRCASSYVRLSTGNLLFRCGGTRVCE
ncbi:MAG: aryl-sulfate sulfotransferase N-terminal domain-containing protein, partial [Planctomycetota bacterium]